MSAGAKSAPKSSPINVKSVHYAAEVAEGAGARVRRSIGSASLRNLSPFLMLDHLNVSPGGGFPDHPHRGQETITMVHQGFIDHEDFVGNKGTLEAGDLQFMTAGRGIMHAEMPRHDASGKPVIGIQLWVDLPKHLKNCEPRYRDLKAKEIPCVTIDSTGSVIPNRTNDASNDRVSKFGEGKTTIKVISGHSHGVDSQQELAYTPVWLLDIKVEKGGRVTQPIPQGWTVFAYLYNGKANFGSGDKQRAVDKHHITVFDNGINVQDSQPAVVIENTGDELLHLVLVAGTPLDQEIFQYGPFVVSSQEAARQAMLDFRAYANGFERARGWESEIGKRGTMA